MTVVFVSLQSKSPVFQSLGGYDGDGGSGGAVDGDECFAGKVDQASLDEAQTILCHCL